MATMSTLKQRLLSHHKDLLEQLEDKYMECISNLLKQKKSIILEMQNQLFQQLLQIDNLASEVASTFIEKPSPKPLLTLDNCVGNNDNKSTENEIIIKKETSERNKLNPIDTDITMLPELENVTDDEQDDDLRSLLDSNKSNRNESEYQKKDEIEKMNGGNWKCPHCGKLFTRKESVTRHIRDVHRKERQFQCNYCRKAFARKDYVKKHKNSCKGFNVHRAKTRIGQ